VLAAIVLGDDFDVPMMVAAVELLLDPEVGKVDALVEVGQVVRARPFFDLVLVAVGSPVAVRPAAIVLLQPFLVLALQFLFEDDSLNVRALVAQALLLAQIGAIELCVMRQLAVGSRPRRRFARASDRGRGGGLRGDDDRFWSASPRARGHRATRTS